MTIEDMRIAREANPFRPFTLRLADGRSFYVQHRDYISMAPNGRRTVIVYGDNDAYSVLDLLLVTELSVDPPTATTPKADVSAN